MHEHRLSTYDNNIFTYCYIRSFGKCINWESSSSGEKEGIISPLSLKQGEHVLTLTSEVVKAVADDSPGSTMIKNSQYSSQIKGL